MRRAVGSADVRHLTRIEYVGRLCGFAGFGTAWLAPNPVSVVLLAMAMMVRFIIGHHIGHGGYEGIDGLPARYRRDSFSRGWRRFVGWLDWWDHGDWLFTHNQLHHANTQSPDDVDVMDSRYLSRLPVWLRVVCMVTLMASWKFIYYAPRMRRDRRRPFARRDRSSRPPAPDQPGPGLGGLLVRCYAPYLAVRFILPALVVSPLGFRSVLSMLVNLVVAELVHNTHTFFCIRPSHCAADIPLFADRYADRQEFYLQSVLGTVNYRTGGEFACLLQGWANYQVEHHLWPTATLLQYKLARSRLQEICRRNGVPYREEDAWTRFRKMPKVLLGLEHQRTIDTGRKAG